MKKSSSIASLAGIALLALPLSLLAQEEEAPAPLSDVWWVIVKPGMDADFATAMATHMQFRADAGETRSWNAYRVAVGHHIAPIQFRACCSEWADLDTYEAEDEEKGLSANFNENVAQYVEHYHHYLEESDWDNSHWPDEGTSGPYYGVTSWTGKQGAGPASGEAKDKMSQLALNEGWANADNNWLWVERIGGKDMIALVSSHENYADMAPPEQSFFEFATEKLGAEEAGAMFGAFSGGFSDSDYSIWVHDESLSTPSADE